MRRVTDVRHSVAGGAGVGALAVAAVSGAIALIDDFVPVLSLGVLYILAVLVVGILYGSVYAIATAVASMLAFNFFFLPPYHTFQLSDGSNWFALAVYVATAIAVGTLAARARHRAAQAEHRERETALLADVAAELLRGTDVVDEAARIAGRTAGLLGVSSVRIESEGTVTTPPGEDVPAESKRRLLPALGALLTMARDRERLAREAIEAETLRRSDAVKTAVIQTVSHDLRTPLATIEAALDGLQNDELELTAADRAALLESVRLEHARLKYLVEDLLDLSRLQAQAAAPVAELWPVDELLEVAIASVPGADRVAVTAHAGLPDARVDAVQAQRVLVNLLDNALRYSPPDTQVMVDAEPAGKEIVIRVSDSGPGVPEHERERIFEPFHRLDQVQREGRRGGAGLGLAIARGFAEANGGRLWLEPGNGGAVFALALPCVPRPAEVAV